DRRVAIDGCTVAELAKPVQSPTVRRAAGDETAVVAIAGADRRKCQTARDWNGRRGQSRVASVAQLARAIPAPTIGRAAGREPASVLLAACDYNAEHEPTIHEVRRRFGRRRTVSKIAISAVAPAIAFTRRRHAAAVRIPGTHVRPRMVSVDQPRRRTAGQRRGVADDAEPTVPPAVRRAGRGERAGVVDAGADSREGQTSRNRTRHMTIGDSTIS